MLNINNKIAIPMLRPINISTTTVGIGKIIIKMIETSKKASATSLRWVSRFAKSCTELAAMNTSLAYRYWSYGATGVE